MELERMSKEQIFSIALFSNLFKTSETAPFADIAFKVLGGNPQKYVSLDARIRGRETIARLLNEPADHADYISQFLTEKIFEAVKTINTATTANPDMVKIIPKLNNSGYELEWEALDGLVPSNPDKVLRRIKTKDGFDVLVPASSAIDIVLRHGLKKEPVIQELIKLLNPS